MVCGYEPDIRSVLKDRSSGVARTRLRSLRGGKRKKVEHDGAEIGRESEAIQPKPDSIKMEMDHPGERSQPQVGAMASTMPRNLDVQDRHFSRYFSIMAGHVIRLLAVYWKKPERVALASFLDRLALFDADLSDEAERNRIIQTIRKGDFDATAGRVLFNVTLNRVVVAIQHVKRAGVQLERDFAVAISFQPLQEGDESLAPNDDQNFALADRDYRAADRALDGADRGLQANVERTLLEIERVIRETVTGAAESAGASPRLNVEHTLYDYVLQGTAETRIEVEYEAGLVSAVTLHAIHDDEQRNVKMRLAKNEILEDGYLLTFNDEAKKWEVAVLVKWEGREVGALGL